MKKDTSIHTVELRLRGLIRTSRFVNEVCVESGNCLFQQVRQNQELLMWRYGQLTEADYPCLAVRYICSSRMDRRDARVLTVKRWSPAGKHTTDAAGAPFQGTLEPTEDLRTKRGTTSIFK